MYTLSYDMKLKSAWSSTYTNINDICADINENKCQKNMPRGEIFLTRIMVWGLTYRGPVDLRKWAIFNTSLMSPKSWLFQEDLDAGCDHLMVPMDS